MPLGGALVGIGLLLSSFGGTLWHFYFSYGLITALGQGALGFVGHNALISFWFVRRRATAIGIASMGQGVGALIMVPLTQFLISRIGWRSTFMVTASLILLAVMPANALLQRRSPQDIGQLPDGDTAAPAESHGAHGKARSGARDWTLREAAGFFSVLVRHAWTPGAGYGAVHDQHAHRGALRRSRL